MERNHKTLACTASNLEADVNGCCYDADCLEEGVKSRCKDYDTIEDQETCLAKGVEDSQKRCGMAIITTPGPV